MYLWMEANRLCSIIGGGRFAEPGAAGNWGAGGATSLSRARSGRRASRAGVVGIGLRGVIDGDVRYVPEELVMAAKAAEALADHSDSRLTAVRFQP